MDRSIQDELTRRVMGWEERRAAAEAAGDPEPEPEPAPPVNLSEASLADIGAQIRAKSPEVADEMTALATLGAQRRQELAVERAVEAIQEAMGDYEAETYELPYLDEDGAETGETIEFSEGLHDAWAKLIATGISQEQREALADELGLDGWGMDNVVRLVGETKTWAEEQQAAAERFAQQQEDVKELDAHLTSMVDGNEKLAGLSEEVIKAGFALEVSRRIELPEDNPEYLNLETATFDDLKAVADHGAMKTAFVAQQFEEADRLTELQKEMAKGVLDAQGRDLRTGEEVTREVKDAEGNVVAVVPILQPFEPDFSDAAWQAFTAPSPEELAEKIDAGAQRLIAEGEERANRLDAERAEAAYQRKLAELEAERGRTPMPGESDRASQRDHIDTESTEQQRVFSPEETTVTADQFAERIQAQIDRDGL